MSTSTLKPVRLSFLQVSALRMALDSPLRGFQFPQQREALVKRGLLERVEGRPIFYKITDAGYAFIAETIVSTA